MDHVGPTRCSPCKTCGLSAGFRWSTEYLPEPPNDKVDVRGIFWLERRKPSTKSELGVADDALGHTIDVAQSVVSEVRSDLRVTLVAVTVMSVYV